MKRIFMLIVLMPLMALAKISISNVEVFSGYPWREAVIGYTITGSTDQLMTLEVLANDNISGKTYECKTLEGVDLAPGSHVIKWNAQADGVKFKSNKVVFMVRAVPRLPLYSVINLSAGATATKYSVTELAEAPSGGWTDVYKTTRLVLRRIEPGDFTMGDSIHGGTNCSVKLTKSFYIGVFEVTQRQWELVMGTRPSYFSNDSYYATRPVDQVSYDMIRGDSLGALWPTKAEVDAMSFLGKLRARTGLDFDLPTEAQWEYACRAGTSTDFNDGTNYSNPEKDLNMDKVGRYWCNGGSGAYYNPSCNTDACTAKVGSYVPNSWGLYDMHGNVSEWCLDWFGNVEAATDPKGASSGSRRVLRGGSWGGYASSCTSFFRDNRLSSDSYYSYGFRIVRTLQR